MVAAVSHWHASHAGTAREINWRRDAGESLVVAAPTLIEAYSVLTRFPLPNRLAPDDAVALLERSFVAVAEDIVALGGEDYVRLFRTAPDRDIVGGRAYDAVIAACAVVASVDAVLTLNARHFRPLLPDGVAVVAP